MQLGHNIYIRRKALGIPQEKLAEQINVSRQTISNWENDETSPNPEQLILLSKVFKCSIDTLLGNDFVNSDNSQEDKEFLNNIRIPLAIITSSIAGIWAFYQNRFRNIEIFYITFIGFAIGICLGTIIYHIIKYIKHNVTAKQNSKNTDTH